MFNKAARIDSYSIMRFGSYAPIDSVRFPIMATTLCNSLGPIESTQLPYKCTFIPYMTRTEIDDMFQQAGYTNHYYESFLQAMRRGRTIMMTDVNIHEQTSSHWWTNYYENVRPSTQGGVTTPGHITAFCPFSYDQRDNNVLLAAIVTEDTLYELPGPCITSKIGPFARMYPPTVIDDIPEHFRSRIAINRHVPAITVKFEEYGSLNHITAVTYGEIQKDQAILDLSAFKFKLDTAAAAPAPASTTATTTTSKGPATSTRSKSRLSTESTLKPPTDPLEIVGPSGAGLYIATIIYFDHRLADRLPYGRRTAIVTAANAAD
jgi:hypothetical protein